MFALHLVRGFAVIILLVFQKSDLMFLRLILRCYEEFLSFAIRQNKAALLVVTSNTLDPQALL